MRHNAYEVARALDSVGPEAGHALRFAINRVLRTARVQIGRNVAQELGVPVRQFQKRAKIVEPATLRDGQVSGVLSFATSEYPARLLNPTNTRTGVKFGGRGNRQNITGGFIARRHPKRGQVEPVPYKRRGSPRIPLDTLGLPVHEPTQRTASGWLRSIGVSLVGQEFARDFQRRVANALARVR